MAWTQLIMQYASADQKKDNLAIFNHLLRICKIKIRLMADYFCYPLWHDDGINMGDIGPASLPISNELKETK